MGRSMPQSPNYVRHRTTPHITTPRWLIEEACSKLFSTSGATSQRRHQQLCAVYGKAHLKETQGDILRLATTMDGRHLRP